MSSNGAAAGGPRRPREPTQSHDLAQQQDAAGARNLGRSREPTRLRSSRRAHPLRSWRHPFLTFVTMSIAMLLVAAVDPVPGAMVLATALTITLSRNRLVFSWRGRVEALVMLPVVALATTGVGELLISLPAVGAIAFVLAMVVSIWLRRFGAAWSRIGSLIAIPFITLLIVPGGGAGTTVLGAAILSLVALVLVVLLRLLAEVTRFLPRETALRETRMRLGADPRARSDRAFSDRAPGLHPIASTRMATQMGLALVAGFALGWLVFPDHVTWVVLTAFLVCSGNRGRADVLYKSGLRILGALGGTIVASVALIIVPPGHPMLQGPDLVAVLLLILGVGLWLRQWNYAAWALAMTLIITLLQGVSNPITPDAGSAQLWERVLAIIVGAICGLAASWFVLPVRSESVVRRRVSDVLASLGGFLADPNSSTDEALAAALDKLNEVAKPWEAWHRVTRWRATSRKPAEWIRLVRECAYIARASPWLNGVTRRALGEARRSVRDPMAIGSALVFLRDALVSSEPGWRMEA